MWAFLQNQGRIDVSSKSASSAISAMRLSQSHVPCRGTEDSAMNQSAGAWRSETSPWLQIFNIPQNEPMTMQRYHGMSMGCLPWTDIAMDIICLDGTHCHVGSLLAWCCHCALIFFSKVASKYPLSLALLAGYDKTKLGFECIPAMPISSDLWTYNLMIPPTQL